VGEGGVKAEVGRQSKAYSGPADTIATRAAGKPGGATPKKSLRPGAASGRCRRRQASGDFVRVPPPARYGSVPLPGPRGGELRGRARQVQPWSRRPPQSRRVLAARRWKGGAETRGCGVPICRGGRDGLQVVWLVLVSSLMMRPSVLGNLHEHIRCKLIFSCKL